MTACSWRRTRDLVVELVWRDIRLAYRRSVLGVAWSQVATLAQIAVLSFVFSRVVPLGIKHYAAFVFVGLLAWLWFSNGMLASAGSVIDGRDLIRRPGFPTPVIPLIAVLTHLAYYLLALPVLLVAVGLSPGLSLQLVALPIVVATQVVVMLGPAYVLAAANVRYRDVAFITGVGLNLLFYASGVFYSVATVPQRFRWLFDFNPIVQLVNAYRNVFLKHAWPPWRSLAIVAVIGAVVDVIAVRYYEARRHEFVDEL